MDITREFSGLSTHELSHLRDTGFIVVKNLLPASYVERATQAIWNYLDMDPAQPRTWYDVLLRERSGLDRRGMIPWYHHQALWDCRTHPAVYQTFRDIWSDTDLAVSIDRVNFNVPITPEWVYDGFIHWDIDISIRPLPLAYQGILALSDTALDGGGFQCVPGFHKQIEGWLERCPLIYNNRFPDITGFDTRTVEMQAGDLLIFNSLLPHGNTANCSSMPRLAQYITMQPWARLDQKFRTERMKSFAQNGAPRSFSGALMPAPRLPNLLPRLSALGQKLLGGNG